MRLEAILEGVLFYKTEPIQKAELARLLRVEETEVSEALSRLSEHLADRGIVLVEAENGVQLMTAPELSETIEQIRKEELKRDIGKAGAETLSIILYRGPLTRSEIDFIRGVNSTFILRNLLVRGLIKRMPHPNDQRSYQYAATPALMAHLGIRKKEELPHYANVLDELDRYEREHQQSEADEETPS